MTTKQSGRSNTAAPANTLGPTIPEPTDIRPGRYVRVCVERDAGWAVYAWRRTGGAP